MNGDRRLRRNQVACDACHTRRVRCDLVSSLPCSHCLRNDVDCKITRKLRKRGRIARSKLANANRTHGVDAPPSPTEQRQTSENCSLASQSTVSSMDPTIPTSVTQSSSPGTNEIDALLTLCMEDCRSMPDDLQLQAGLGRDVTEECLPTAHLLNSLPQLSPEDNEPPLPLQEIWKGADMAPDTPSQGHHPPTLSQPPTNYHLPDNEPILRLSTKYPVLSTVMPVLEKGLPPQLVFHLLELYFTSPFPNILHRSSFLRDEFRVTSPALLTSMLWMAAIDHRASLSIPPSQHRKICQFLGDLTRALLQSSDDASPKNQEPSLAGLHCSSMAVHPVMENDVQLDQVITYIHIASVVSTEQEAAGMRWWKTAFSLARELKLNQEAEIVPDFDKQINGLAQSFADGLSNLPKDPNFSHSNGTQSSLNSAFEQIHDSFEIHDQSYHVSTEEHNEERRRIWWLLYIIDRHLALSHNRPPEILDSECGNLLLPLDETLWQGGSVHSNSLHSQGLRCFHPAKQNELQVFPGFRCRDSSIFGFFLPLMTITGEVMGLNNLRLEDNEACKVTETEVLSHLEVYQTSLSAFMASSTVSAEVSNRPDMQLVQDHGWQTQTVVAYSSYLVQVLHTSLVGKWDWQFLLEDKEFWTSPAFTSTISHSLDAAFWLRQILQLDPDISFIPYLFGIQLIQGSFPLLLIVERLQDKSEEDILNACEIMMQATDSCLVTRNTYYQRTFRQLIRSAVSQAWGRPVSAGEIRRRRKAVFDLWLWIRRKTNWSTVR
ncbi:Transcription factor, fungi [Penicillium expansum]|uniref:Transcription factor, fungi n=1 Tax=Penicillium expansum TaxID=27334 RepID=A0A0A2JTS5_PENEN|nr:Transcription factor, fungi [Penicillium expansum]KGO46253.1 Transcription factor, fungi [Penicillium expansum]KGO50465.1 Transcription factor, fungi [Penicillium expansum]KGO58206.1 Transcription factor, fungi [Penicillium expansum]